MPSGDDEEAYTGRLVFNGLFRTTVHDDDLNPSELVNDLPTFSEGEFGNPGDGYKDYNAASRLRSKESLDPEYHRFVQNLYSFRHLYEDWEVKSGKRGDQEVYETKTTEIFWEYPNYMFFRGEKNQVNSKKKDIARNMTGRVRLEEIAFDQDFFLWILHQFMENEKLTRNLEIRRFTSAKTEGSKNTVGQEIVANESTNISKCAPALISLLEGNGITQIECGFMHKTNYMKSRIKDEGGVRILVSGVPMEDMSKSDRLKISLPFLRELVRVYDLWNRLPNKKRYPPDNFFTQLKEECDQEGYVPKFEHEDIRREYRLKREGKWESDGGVDLGAFS